MRFFADRTTTLLQIFHVIVDGLYDSVPILLSFMIVAFGAQEKDAGVILSVAALLGTLAGLGTKGCSQRFGFLRTLCLITGAYGVGYAANTFSQHILVLGLFLRHCHDGAMACSTTRRFRILRCAPSVPCSAKCWGTSRP